MPTKTMILLAAILGMLLLIVVAIIITVVVTGNFLAKKGEDTPTRTNDNFLLYLKNVENYKCPKCGSDLKLYLGKDKRTYYRCKAEKCDFMVEPETLIKK